jgi:hypothetical protein
VSAVDREALFKTRLPEEEYELPGLGTFRIRGLSRGEVLAAQADDPRLAVFERRLLARGIVDPKLTETDVGRWQEASPSGEMEPLIARIQLLSGIGREVEKGAYESFRDDPGTGIRDVPGGETDNDSGAATGGNVG